MKIDFIKYFLLKNKYRELQKRYKSIDTWFAVTNGFWLSTWLINYIKKE